jgi:hypothetical protein
LRENAFEMKKKHIWIVLPLVLLLALFLLRNHFRLPTSDLSPMEAVPNSSPFVFAFDDLPQLKKTLAESPYAASFGKTPFLAELSNDLALMDSLFAKALPAEKRPSERPFLAAAQVNGAKNFDYLYVFNIYNENIEAYLKKLKPKTSTFHQQQVCALTLPTGDKLSYCIFKNLLLVARQSFVVEDAIAQLGNVSENIPNNRAFGLVAHEAKGKAEPTIYWNFDNFPLLLTTLVQPEKTSETEFWAEWLEWAKLTPSFEENGIQLKGPCALQDDAWMQLLCNDKPSSEFDMAKVLPDNTAIVAAYSTNKLEKMAKTSGENDAFSKYILPWCTGDFAQVLVEPSSANFRREQFLLLRAKDGDLANERIAAYGNASGVAENIDYQIFKIKKIVADDLLAPLHCDIKHPYYTQLGDYVLFGSDESSMKIWIDKYLVGATLSNDTTFLKFQQGFKFDYNYLNYASTGRLLHWAKAFANEDLQADLPQQLETYNKFGQLGFQLAGAGGQFRLESFLHFAPEKRQSVSVAWRAELDAPAATVPSVLENPAATDRYIFVQDTSNNAYLFDKNGNRLWKKPFGDRVLSKVYAIDFYKNNKVQFLFNTKNNLYLIDKEGRNVGNYPIPLHSPATNGLAVTNYYNDGNYRIFVACQNGNIYGFFKDGQPVSGWNPQINVGIVRQPLLHFLANRKDYLVALNEKGGLHCFKANGERHFGALALQVAAGAEFGGDSVEKFERVAVNAENGKVKIVNLATGAAFNLATPVGDNKHVRFAFANVAGDPRKDYIVLNNNALAVYAYNSENKLAKTGGHTFEEAQDAVFPVRLANEPYAHIGTYSKAKSRIYLIDGSGKPYSSFPLAGASPFESHDLFNDGKNALVTTKGASLYVYKVE